jgi:hypothetical protein
VYFAGEELSQATAISNPRELLPSQILSEFGDCPSPRGRFTHVRVVILFSFVAEARDEQIKLKLIDYP